MSSLCPERERPLAAQTVIWGGEKPDVELLSVLSLDKFLDSFSHVKPKRDVTPLQPHRIGQLTLTPTLILWDEAHQTGISPTCMSPHGYVDFFPSLLTEARPRLLPRNKARTW